MNRLFYAAIAAAAATGIAAAPAVAGLSHNPSFSHKLPVRVPSGAHTVNLSDEHGARPHPTHAASVTVTRGREVEPGDDRGQQVEATDMNDDNGVHGSAAEPGDDNGHDGAIVGPSSAAVVHELEPEAGDDKGGASAEPVTASLAPQPAEASDDSGHGGGSSSGHESGGHGDR